MNIPFCIKILMFAVLVIYFTACGNMTSNQAPLPDEVVAPTPEPTPDTEPTPRPPGFIPGPGDPEWDIPCGCEEPQ